MATKILSVRVPVEVLDKIERLAAKDERSRSWLVVKILSEWVRARKG